MKKELSRRSFMLGSGVLVFGSSGIFFTGCDKSTPAGTMNMSKEEYTKDKEEYTKDKEESTKEIEEAKPVAVKASDRTITVSADNLNSLKSTGYLNSRKDGLVVFHYDGEFYGYKNVCPHEQGELVIENATTIRCQRHTCQSFSNKGVSSKCNTNASLKLITLDVKAQ